jgi:hypothetical protein
MREPYDPIDDDDLLTARRELRDLAEKACGELDARMLNTLSFHLGAYLCQVKANNGTLKVYNDEGLTTRIMGEIEADLRGWGSDYGKTASRRIRAELHDQAVRRNDQAAAKGE